MPKFETDYSNFRYVLLVNYDDAPLRGVSEVFEQCVKQLTRERESIKRACGLECHRFHLPEPYDVFANDVTESTPGRYLAKLQKGTGRIAIYPRYDVIPNEPIPHEAQHGFVIIYPDESCTGWQPEGEPWIQASVGLTSGFDGTVFAVRVPALVSDLLLDMSLANSACMREVLDGAISTHTRQGLYRMKVDFILREYGEALTSHGRSGREFATNYGPVTEQSRYVSFSSVARKFKPREHYSEAVRIWDQFILRSLADHLPSRTAVLDNLRKRDSIGGQLSRQLLARELDQHPKAGAYVLLRPQTKPELTIDRKRVMSIFRMMKWNMRPIRIIHAEKFPKDLSQYLYSERFYMAARDRNADPREETSL